MLGYAVWQRRCIKASGYRKGVERKPPAENDTISSGACFTELAFTRPRPET